MNKSVSSCYASRDQQCPVELSVMMEMFSCVWSTSVATSYV